jgi:hypothetical protein
MNTKTRLILIITGIILAVLAIIFFVIRPIFFTTPPEAPAPIDFAAPQRWDDTFIAGHTLAWLEDETRDDRGAYGQLVNCSYDDELGIVCEAFRSNRTGMAVIWANYMYWRHTNNPQALQRMSQALEVYSDRTLVQLIQTDELSCYLLLPIINDNSPAITAADRQNARQICADTEYESWLNFLAWDDVDYMDDVDFEAAIAAHISNVTGAPFVDDVLIIEDFSARLHQAQQMVETLPIHIEQALFATDLLARYQVDSNPATLDHASLHFIAALRGYADMTEAPDINQYCQLALASQSFCLHGTGVASESSCELARHLGSQIANININTHDLIFPNYIAQCAFAFPAERDRFVGIIRDFYYSPANSRTQYTQPWLLNLFGGLTFEVIDNALFAGLLVW